MGQYGPENELLVLDKTSLKLDTITHYTSIPTLFKILRSQNILFNRIDNVNDLTEKESLMKHENYRRLFVSCFSIRKSESIPMWRMYTKKDTGIMLQFKFRQGYKAEEFFVRDFVKSSDGSMFVVFLYVICFTFKKMMTKKVTDHRVVGIFMKTAKTIGLFILFSSTFRPRLRQKQIKTDNFG